jgi:hypothetical protein
MVRCAACGHTWIECRDLEVIDVPARNLPAPIEPASPVIAERKVRRLVDASLAQEAFVAKRRERSRRRRSWAIFVAARNARGARLVLSRAGGSRRACRRAVL